MPPRPTPDTQAFWLDEAPDEDIEALEEGFEEIIEEAEEERARGLGQ